MINHGSRVAILPGNPFKTTTVRVMNRFTVGDFGQLGNPFADVVSLRIELLALKQWIEDSKIRLRVNPEAGTESPSAVIGGKVPINEVLHEISLTHPPVNQQVLGQERGYNHTTPVVHICCLSDLSHRRVYDWEPRLAVRPFSELLRIILPLNVAVFGFERFVHAVEIISLRAVASDDELTRYRASGTKRGGKSLAMPPRQSTLNGPVYGRQSTFCSEQHPAPL